MKKKWVGQDDFVNQKRILGRRNALANSKGKEVSVLVKQGYQSSIDKFKLEDENENDVTDQILHLPKVYLIFLVINQRKFVKKEDIHKNEISFSRKRKNENPIYEIQQKNHFLKGENLTMDGTAIKTIARSNPFVLVLENGKLKKRKVLKIFKKKILNK